MHSVADNAISVFNIYENGFGWKEYLTKYHLKDLLSFKKDEFGNRYLKYPGIIIDVINVIKYEREYAKISLDETGHAPAAINILSKEIHFNPDNVIQQIKMALDDLKPEYSSERFEIHFTNASWPLDIKEIRIDNLNKLFAITCSVSRTSTVRPVLINGAWECAKCGTITYIDQIPGENEIKPGYCQCNEKIRGLFRLNKKESKYLDFQMVRLIETVDSCSDGHQPQEIDAELLNDLCGDLIPGESVVIYGIPRLVEKRDSRGYVKTNKEIHIEVVGFKRQDRTEFIITPEDEAKIISLSKLPDIKEKIVNSIAPSIYGQYEMKRALSFALVSGGKRIFKDGTQQRGNSHVLFVGDPGVAKSVILKAGHRLCVRSIYLSDKGVSGAGLTFAAVKENFNGEKWTITAGALPMCNGGFVFLDELDKMTDTDRDCLHGVLENLEIDAAKAGLRAKLKAETSLITAANPKLGKFDEYVNIADQIGLPPALLSRFDIIVVVKDHADKDNDSRVADYIVSANADFENDTFLDPEIDEETLKKYLYFARTRINPTLQDRASAAYLKQIYVDLRSSSKGLKITPRQLGGIIRLARSSARLRLSSVISKSDIDDAVELYIKTIEEASKGENGECDIGVINGVTNSQADRMKAIFGYMQQNDNEDGVYKKDIVNALKEQGFDDASSYRSINELIKKGKLIVIPSTGKLKSAYF